MEWEQGKAMLSLAGVRQVKQTTVTVTTSNTTYTVTEKATRRLIVVHGSATYGDIRFNPDATATTTSFPILGSTYFVIDVEKDDVINFIGVPASTVVNLMEIQ